MTTAAAEQGLSRAEAAQRLNEYGLNEIKREKGRSSLHIFVEQFKSPLVLILICAILLSSLLGEYMEASAITAILFINAIIGFFQEYRAESAILSLRKMTAPRAKVIRDGQHSLLLAQDIVPGDLLLLEAGDIVAADAILIEAARLQVNEAVLTGESLPVEKFAPARRPNTTPGEQHTQVFMGTTVVTGVAVSEVTATGMKTELGKIAHLIATAQSEPTPLQVQLQRVGLVLLWICLSVVALVASIGFIQGRSGLDLVIFSLSLAVAAVPEGLPAIVTVALALGIQKLAAHNALVRKLPSVETLGSVSVICTDKTGTLTTGAMRVREVWGKDARTVLKAAAACCDAELDDSGVSGTGDASELAILIAALEQGLRKEVLETENPRVAVEPFDSERRRMSILRQDGLNYVKGAVEAVCSLCLATPSELAETQRAASAMAAQGLRVLAIAIGQGAGEKQLQLLGLLGIADPPRQEAKAAIKEAREAGIIPIMITGDHPTTAAAIARELGLVLAGESCQGRVHARATPEDKLQLVRQWKNNGHIVAMTGDGVNDAPALREAHIGIAMGQAGTEVTRQAADLVLTDDNFATIIAAVREGRHIFQNIRKALSYLLMGNLAEILVVLGAILLGLPLPLLATQLLWINLVTDALPAMALIAEPLAAATMHRPPRAPQEALLGRPEWTEILWVGLLEASMALALFCYLLQKNDLVYARSLLFSGFIFSQLLRAFAARSRSQTLWRLGFFSNPWLLGIVLATFFLQLTLHHLALTQQLFALTPLSLNNLLLILPFSLIPLTVIEIKKVVKQTNCE